MRIEVAAFAIAACAAFAVAQDLQPKDLHPASVARQRALADKVQSDFKTRHRYSQDGVVLGYIAGLGAKIAPGAVFHVLATSDIFATAFPQGHIYVTNGLLSHVQDEAELAGVLAHEAAHAAAGLDFRPTSPASPIRIAYSGEAGGLCLRFGISPVTVAPLTIGRERETRADLDAALLLRNAGYSPVAMLDFFEQLRPAPGDLSSERFELAGSVPPESVITTSAFEAMQNRLRSPAPHLSF